MRSAFAAFALVFTAACGAAGSAATAPEPAPADVITGKFDALEPGVGDVKVERAGLIFDAGATLYTRVLSPRAPSTFVAAGGTSFADLMTKPGLAAVELRRVTGREGVQLCADGAAPTYVALARDGAGLSVVVFSGEEPPGPQAQASAVCARYAYRAA